MRQRVGYPSKNLLNTVNFKCGSVNVLLGRNSEKMVREGIKLLPKGEAFQRLKLNNLIDFVTEKKEKIENLLF